MRTLFIGSFVFTLIAAVGAASCTGTTTLPSSTVSTLSITGSAPSIGATSQFSAVAVLAGSTAPINVSSTATWQTDNGSIATVSSTGVVKGVSAGSVTVTATYEGTSASDKISIP